MFLQRLETARRGAYSTGLALLLGATLHDVAQRGVSARAKERYLQRSRAAYRQVVKNEPFSASGYLGLADVAATGQERVDWLRGAVQAEFRPAHMELLANALSTEIGGHPADLEAARFVEDAYTYESTRTERWRYGASALQRHREALGRYPTATSERAAENVELRIKDDIDYPLLQRILLTPQSHLPHLAGAFATMCDESIAAVVTLDECMAGLELAVSTAEGMVSWGERRLLAEATLAGMRTIAGELPPVSVEAQRKFPDWIERLLATGPEPADVAADLLEARADYTRDLLERASALTSAVDLSRNRWDLRSKLGATFVDLELWQEALDELRVAKLLSPPEEHERVDKLLETANAAFEKRFLPAGVAEPTP